MLLSSSLPSTSGHLRTGTSRRIIPQRPARLIAHPPISISRLPTSVVVVAASQPGIEEQRSPTDAPQEWEAPQPSKRPDIFPEFDKMDKVFLPKPLPGDPEMPDEEMEETRKRTTPGDPDPEQKPGEPPEMEPEPSDPGQEPEKRSPGEIPTSPE